MSTDNRITEDRVNNILTQFLFRQLPFHLYCADQYECTLKDIHAYLEFQVKEEMDPVQEIHVCMTALDHTTILVGVQIIAELDDREQSDHYVWILRDDSSMTVELHRQFKEQVFLENGQYFLEQVVG